MFCLVDVLILADGFERFRSVSMEKGRFEVDPAHYELAPQIDWDAMLKKRGMTLDLITDLAMYQMIDSGMRGGVCMISPRYAKANNELVGEYNPEQPKTYMSDWDANNLNGWAMSQPLPYGKFEWVGPEEWQTVNWQHLGDNDYNGYIVECDLEYPPDLHEAYNYYTLAPERLDIQVEMLSDAQVAISREQQELPYPTTATSNSTWIIGCASIRYTE